MNRSLISLTSLLLLITSFQAFSFQNVEKLLADPNITWVGEVEVDFFPNARISEPVDVLTEKRYGVKDYNNFEVLKTQNRIGDDWFQRLKNQLSDRLLQLNSKDLNVYEDADLTKKLSYEAYQKIGISEEIDTIITFDPETFEEIVQVVVRQLRIEEVVQFKVKHILAYNAKTNQLTILPIAIAPINSSYKTPNQALFWMPIEEVFQSINLESSSIDWAKRLTKDVPSESVKTIKGTGTVMDVFDQMLAYYNANPSTSEIYYHIHHDDKLTPFSPTIIKELGSSTDTIVTFHPETFEEIIEVVKNKISPQFAVKIQLIEDWVWNTKTQKMQIRVLGYAPVIYRIDSRRKYQPLYYVKTKQ